MDVQVFPGPDISMEVFRHRQKSVAMHGGVQSRDAIAGDEIRRSAARERSGTLPCRFLLSSDRGIRKLGCSKIEKVTWLEVLGR